MTAEKTSQFSITRRQLLIGGGAAITGIGLLSWNGNASAHAAWVESVVRNNLPGIAIDEHALATFVKHILAGEHLKPKIHRFSVAARHAAPWLTARIPSVHSALKKLERRVLTEFLLGSNFFRVADPKRERITYYGPAVACMNPFARRY